MIEVNQDNRSWKCPNCNSWNRPRYGNKITKCRNCKLKVKIEVGHQERTYSVPCINEIELVNKK